MKRVGFALLALGLAGAGLLSAAVLAGTSLPALSTSTDTTVSTETLPGTTTPTTTATSTSTAPATTPTTTTTTTTAPPPKPKPPQPARIAAGVTIGGVHVGGLGADAAYQAVHVAFEAPLVLLVGAERISVAPAQLGTIAYVKATVAQAIKAPVGTKVPLRMRVQSDALRDYVKALAETVDRKALDASVFLRNLTPAVTKSRSGRALDQKEARRALIAALVANRRTNIRLPLENVKPKTTTSDFGPVIVIRRGSNHLYLYTGERLTRVFGVATGQTTYPTPLGRFSIVVKWRDPWWYPPDSPWAQGTKPIPPGPGNPLGTRWMGLSAPGVGIHGTPDPASIGYSLSHGCIRMYIPEAEWLFNHVDIGTPVFIVAA